MSAPAKVVIIGDQRVGKTSLLRRLETNSFVEQYYRTHSKKIINKSINKTSITVADVPETEVSIHLQSARVVLLMYDVVSEQSFVNISHYWDLIQDTCPYATVIILANKTDLNEIRAMPSSRGLRRAADLGVSFFEISCKDNQGINEVLAHITKEVSAPVKNVWSSVDYQPMPIIGNAVNKEQYNIGFWAHMFGLITCKSTCSDGSTLGGSNSSVTKTML